MSKGMTNFQIDDVLKNLKDEDIKESFVCVFLKNQMNRFIDYKTMISERKRKYPSIITNTDSCDKSDTH